MTMGWVMEIVCLHSSLADALFLRQVINDLFQLTLFQSGGNSIPTPKDLECSSFLGNLVAVFVGFVHSEVRNMFSLFHGNHSYSFISLERVHICSTYTQSLPLRNRSVSNFFRDFWMAFVSIIIFETINVLYLSSSKLLLSP